MKAHEWSPKPRFQLSVAARHLPAAWVAGLTIAHQVPGLRAWGVLGLGFGFGFRVWDLGFGVRGFGFGVWGFRVLGFSFLGLGFRGWVQGLGPLMDSSARRLKPQADCEQ